MITRDHGDAAVVKLRNEFDLVLTSGGYCAVLADVLAEHPIAKDKTKMMMDLYQIRALLEYENGDRWNRAHPIVKPLLERQQQRQLPDESRLLDALLQQAYQLISIDNLGH